MLYRAMSSRTLMLAHRQAERSSLELNYMSVSSNSVYHHGVKSVKSKCGLLASGNFVYHSAGSWYVW